MTMEQNGRIDPEITGKFIAELRKSHNLTQEELADKLFITRKAVSKWETGRACPSIDILKRLSDSFGVPLENFISGKLSDDREFKNGKIVVKEKEYKINIKLLVVIIALIMAILSIIFSSIDASTAYNINYQGKDIVIQKGSLIFSSNYGYFNLGKVLSNKEGLKINSDFSYSIYIKKQNKYERILESNILNTITINKKNSTKIQKMLKDSDSLLYVKLFDITPQTKETDYLQLEIVKKIKPEETTEEQENSLLENINVDSLSNMIFHKEVTDKEETSNTKSYSYDLAWLFECPKKRVKELNNKKIYVNKLKYTVVFEEKEEEFVKIFNKDDGVIVYLNSNFIRILPEREMLFPAGKNIFVFNDSNKENIALLKELKKII